MAIVGVVYNRYGSHWSASSILFLYYLKKGIRFERSEGKAADMYGPIEEDNFSDLDNSPASPSPCKGPSTSGVQHPTRVGQQKSTNPDWNSDGSSNLKIVEVKEISSTRKLDINSSEDEGFP